VPERDAASDLLVDGMDAVDFIHRHHHRPAMGGDDQHARHDPCAGGDVADAIRPNNSTSDRHATSAPRTFATPSKAPERWCGNE
jgi:hypothetical protein